MYHRFEENKYPSTNIRNEIFIEHLKEINNQGIEFINFEKFEKIIKTNIDKNYLLLTIDDAFESFYLNAWPILKNKQIPFILFVSTREIGKYGYMTWKNIKEVAASDLVTIGNHSHTHEYLIDWEDNKIKSDLITSIKIFKKELGYSPKIFSYPFGEYSLEQKNYISIKFKFAFGQHSGVIDLNKDKYEFLQWDFELGDCGIFDIRTLHGVLSSSIPKKTLSRYTLSVAKEDAKISYAEDLTNFTYTQEMINAGYKDGDVLGGKMFPQLWPKVD